MGLGELRGRVPSWVTRRMEKVNCGVQSPLFMEAEKKDDFVPYLSSWLQEMS